MSSYLTAAVNQPDRGLRGDGGEEGEVGEKNTLIFLSNGGTS